MLICADVGSLKPCDHEGCVGREELETLDAGVLCSLPPLLILFGDSVKFSCGALYPQYHKHQHAWNLVIYMGYSNL